MRIRNVHEYDIIRCANLGEHERILAARMQPSCNAPVLELGGPSALEVLYAAVRTCTRGGGFGVLGLHGGAKGKRRP